MAEECQRYDECTACTDVHGAAVIDIEYADDLSGTWPEVCADPQLPASAVLRDRGPRRRPVLSGRRYRDVMTVVWTTAFLDLPDDVHERTVAFWRAATGTTLSPVRGDRGQFASLLSDDADPCLKVQRLGEVPRVHLDLHVTDLPAAAARAVAAGATILVRAEHVVLSSPGGFVLCLVPDQGLRRRPGAVVGPRGGVSRVNEMCLDLPVALAAAEQAFWSALTGWSRQPTSRPEFTALLPDVPVPVTVLLQSLGADDPRQTVTGHLDVACGPTSALVAAEHQDRGARPARTDLPWSVLIDPAGLVYCLSDVEPGRVQGTAT